MEFRTADDCMLTLTILGYQYPHLIDAPYDSNWLLVQLDGITTAGQWKRTDACLLTYEAQGLADWLEEGVQGTITRNCGFIEPCLRFEASTDSAGTTLRVILDHEFRPPWAVGQVMWEEGYVMEFALAAADFQTAATTLRRDLTPYPQRAAR